MFCPKCKAEYRSGFTVCADCDVPLVDKLPEEKELPPKTPSITPYKQLKAFFTSAEIAIMDRGSGLDIGQIVNST